MDNYRDVEILADLVVADSGTRTIDLNVTEPITELAVDIKVKNTAVVCNDMPAERIISKIEIVDGGKVYWSCSGAEAIAISCYEKGRWPPVWLYEGASGNQRAHIPLSFGRYLGDEQYAFSPTRLLNPQLKVTWAKNALHTTAQVELGVYAKLMQGVSPPSQALLTKAIRAFTTAGSGVEPTDLPVDQPYRRLFIRGELSGTAFTSIFSHYKLDCDVASLVVFDLGQRNMVNRCETEFGFFSYRKHDFVDDGRLVRSWLGRTMACSLQSGSGGRICNGYTTSSDNYCSHVDLHDNTGQTDLTVVAEVMGSFPQYTLCYQFGRKEDPASWFNPTRFGAINLQLTQGTADAVASILLQQPVPLP